MNIKPGIRRDIFIYLFIYFWENAHLPPSTLDAEVGTLSISAEKAKTLLTSISPFLLQIKCVF